MDINQVSSNIKNFKKNKEDTNKNQVTYVKTIDLIPNDKNKEIYDDFEETENFNLLCESIKKEGVLQPLLIVPHLQFYNKYEIVAGHRRFEASKRAGLKEVPAMIVNRELSDDIDIQISLITTNLLVRNKTPQERLKEIEELEPLIKKKKWNNREKYKGISTRQMLAKATGLNERTLADYLNINNNLNDEDMKDFKNGKLSLVEAKEKATKFKKPKNKKIKENKYIEEKNFILKIKSNLDDGFEYIISKDDYLMIERILELLK